MSDAFPGDVPLNYSDAWLASTSATLGAVDALDAPRRVYLDRDCEIFCLVSPEDYGWVMQWRWKWVWDRTKTKRYAKRTPRVVRPDGTIGTVSIYLHKEILKRSGKASQPSCTLSAITRTAKASTINATTSNGRRARKTAGTGSAEMGDVLNMGAPAAVSYPRGIPRDVCLYFEKLALDLIREGFRRYSADGILHRVRWHWQVERGDRGFKVNNNWSAPLARWFVARNPSAKGFFEMRIAKPAPIRAYAD